MFQSTHKELQLDLNVAAMIVWELNERSRSLVGLLTLNENLFFMDCNIEKSVLASQKQAARVPQPFIAIANQFKTRPSLGNQLQPENIWRFDVANR